MAHLKCGKPLGSKDNIERKRKTKCQDHIIVSDQAVRTFRAKAPW